MLLSAPALSLAAATSVPHSVPQQTAHADRAVCGTFRLPDLFTGDKHFATVIANARKRQRGLRADGPAGQACDMQQAVQAFLLGFPALFSIVNPPSAAFNFWQASSGFTDQERARLARRVATYALVVMLVALWAGAYILEIFGLTVAALRVAGGLVVAASAWGRLAEPQWYEVREAEQASATGRPDDIAFFPLTLPFTTGPGTISVAVALSAGHPPSGRPGYWAFFLGLSVAAAAMALVILVSFRFADGIASRLGKIGRQTVTRLFAFLLLCIGVQILIGGVEEVIRPLLSGSG